MPVYLLYKTFQILKNFVDLSHLKLEVFDDESICISHKNKVFSDTEYYNDLITLGWEVGKREIWMEKKVWENDS